MQFILSPM